MRKQGVNKEHTRIISNKPDSISEYLKKTFHMSGLAVSFARNELLGRSAQTFFGHFINLIQIIVSTCLYWLIFGYILKLDTGNIPFPLFVLTGLIPWVYFSGLVREAGNSLTDNQHIISKIYFPRILLPISKTIPGLLDLLFGFILAFIYLLVIGMNIKLSILALPVFVLIIAISGLAIGIWISSLSVKNRDFARLIPYFINFGFFLTPVFYPTSIVPNEVNFILYFNPAAFGIEGIRWALLGTEFPDIKYLFSLIPVALLFLHGWRNYRIKEKHYADII